MGRFFPPSYAPSFIPLSFISFISSFFLILSAIANAVIIYPGKSNSKDKGFILAYRSTGIHHGGEDRTPELQVGMMVARARGWLVTLHLYSSIREWLGSRTEVESFKATPTQWLSSPSEAPPPIGSTTFPNSAINWEPSGHTCGPKHGSSHSNTIPPEEKHSAWSRRCDSN